jgi:DNA-binding CsgD family transcriptional regulator
MTPVILVSAVSYTVLALLTTAGRFLIPPAAAIYANVLAGGVFVLIWAVTAMAVSARWIGGRGHDDGVPGSFITDYQITPREAEILAVLAEGKTAVHIGETLFISQRTVEAHLYNVYRKCNVKNRVVLLTKIASYRG